MVPGGLSAALAALEEERRIQSAAAEGAPTADAASIQAERVEGIADGSGICTAWQGPTGQLYSQV